MPSSTFTGPVPVPEPELGRLYGNLGPDHVERRRRSRIRRSGLRLAPDDPGVDDGTEPDEFAELPANGQTGGWRGFLSRIRG